MKTPLLLVPLVLVWSLADGAIVSKCELRDELENSIGNLKVTYRQETLTGDDLVAKIVCYAQLASHFNTSLVRDVHTDQFHQKTKELSSSTTKAAEVDSRGMFYGIFQLSSQLVCSDGTTSSPVICGLACSNLLDVNLRDDIDCLRRVFTDSGSSGLEAAEQQELKRMIRLILLPRCSHVQPSVYFAECP